MTQRIALVTGGSRGLGQNALNRGAEVGRPRTRRYPDLQQQSAGG